MRINNNIMSLNAHRQLGANQQAGAKSMEKLSSGLRINRAGDDAAGLAISEKMRGQIRGLNQASRNAQDGISMIQTAEGSLNESHAILQRMRELATQSANDTNTAEDRKEIQAEVDQLAAELSRIGDNTEFNTQNLLDGSLNVTFHIGANQGQYLDLKINDMRADALGVVEGNAGLRIADLSADSADAALLATAAVGAESYDVERLSENVKVASIGGDTDVEIGSVLKNSSGEIVAALDKEGRNLYLATTADEDMGDVVWGGADYKIDFGANNAVTSGEITFSGGGDASTAITATASEAVATFTGDATVPTGTYTVVDDSHNLVANSEFGLVDGSGNLVAYSADGTAWENMSGDALFGYDLTGAVGDEVEIAGEGGIDVSSQSAADRAITIINNAIEKVSTERSNLGATQNRLEHTISNLGTASENLQAAESRIRDLDMAEEMMSFTKSNILNQAATAMLAQANMAPQNVLQLLG